MAKIRWVESSLKWVAVCACFALPFVAGARPPDDNGNDRGRHVGQDDNRGKHKGNGPKEDKGRHLGQSANRGKHKGPANRSKEDVRIVESRGRVKVKVKSGDRGRHIGQYDNRGRHLGQNKVIVVQPRRSDAYYLSRLSKRRQATKNEWRNIAIASGLLSAIGLLKHDNTLVFIGAAGALYSLDRYEQDRRSQSKIDRLRASYFSRPYFYRDGRRYVRRTVVVHNRRYYRFVRR